MDLNGEQTIELPPSQYVDSLKVDIKVEDNNEESEEITIEDFTLENGTKNVLSGILKAEEDGKPFTCQICSKSFSFQFFLQKHMEIHIDEPDKAFKCELCSDAFKNFDSLQSHVVTTHTNLARFFTTPLSNTPPAVSQIAVPNYHLAIEERKWNEANSKMLINLYSKYRGLVGSAKIKTLKQMWIIIGQELSSQFKMIVTGSNAENRWRVLERSYKKYIEYEGTEKRFFEYADDMGKLLRYRRHPIANKNTSLPPKPPVQQQKIQQHQEPLASNTSKTKLDNDNTEEKRIAMQQNGNDIRKNPTAKYRINGFQRLQLERLKYERKRLLIEKEKLKLFKMRNDLLKARNEILAGKQCKCHRCPCSSPCRY